MWEATDGEGGKKRKVSHKHIFLQEKHIEIDYSDTANFHQLLKPGVVRLMVRRASIYCT